MEDSLKKSAKSLEEAFFYENEDDLIGALKEQKEVQDKIKTLSLVSGITDPNLLNIGVVLGIEAETFSALSLVPLIKVAWSDHNIDPKEFKVILKSAHQISIEEGSLAYRLLEDWLSREINPNLFIIWEGYIKALKKELSIKDFELLKKEIISRCKTVAKASGGFLGIGNVSNEEKTVLSKIESAFQ